MALVMIRCLLIVVCAGAGAALRPLAPPTLTGGALVVANVLLGLAVGAAGLLLEWTLRSVPFRTLAAGLIGALIGAGTAALLEQAMPRQEEIRGWPVSPGLLRPVLFLALALAGMLIGAQKGRDFRVDRILALFRPSEDRRLYKILDTSVIIDGRVADVCETGFLDGIIVVPQFILRELQAVADSSDALKRNRGRKGLDILQRVKRMGGITVLMPDTDFPQVREVDQKLIELALRMGAKIVTNDFNLNKVAQLRGVEVLNINELANALRPVVLPGETMKVFVLKEGKEPNQGVAYLDDGTMVVIDNARSQLGETVEIVVTSVLQTTAGKMFFGRCVGDLDRPQIRRHVRPDRERKEEDDPSREGSG